MRETTQGLTIRVCRGLYARRALLAAVYRYTDDYSVAVDEEVEDWVVTVQPKDGSSLSPSETLAAQLRNDLIDHQLRCDLEESFRPLREMIVAKAFRKEA